MGNCDFCRCPALRPALLLPSSPWLSLEVIAFHVVQTLSWAAHDVFPFSCAPDWKNWGGEGRRRLRSVLECGSSFNQCGISSSWGHRNTCVFLSVFQGTVDGSRPVEGNLVKAHLHPRPSKDVHRALLIIENKIRGDLLMEL